MDASSANIFASTSFESGSKLQSISTQLQQFAQSLVNRFNSMVSSLSLSKQVSEKISQNFTKTKEILNQNKELIIGISVIGLLYIVKQQRSQAHRHNRSKHIHSLTSNPISSSKRSGSNKKVQSEGDNNRDKRQNQLRLHSKKSSNQKLSYLKAFISQEEYIQSDQEDKDNPDFSASTRRTESRVSDIEPLKRIKKIHLQPILDLVEEEDQTQDRVFFEMFRTYRDS